MTESHDHQVAPEAIEDETPEPLNRAERRAAKRNKGKNKTKGIVHGVRGQAFTPKDLKVAGHKEFTNRKSG